MCALSASRIGRRPLRPATCQISPSGPLAPRRSSSEQKSNSVAFAILSASGRDASRASVARFSAVARASLGVTVRTSGHVGRCARQLRYRARVRHQLSAHGGHEVDTAGDGFFATFEDIRGAFDCATALVPAVRELGLAARIGIHYGECDMRGEKPSGINVHTAARVMAEAGTNEVLASEEAREAIGPDVLSFEDRGPRALKGVPGERRLYALS